MKLKELLSEMHGETVKLGSASSFVFCGKVDENTEGVLVSLSRLELSNLKERYERYVHHDKNFDKVWDMKLKRALETLEKNAKTTFNEKELKRKELLAIHNKKKESDRRTTDIQLESLPRRIETFTDFTEREVLDRYPSEFGGYVIIFEGEENGSYWTVEEYEEANGGKEIV